MRCDGGPQKNRHYIKYANVATTIIIATATTNKVLLKSKYFPDIILIMYFGFNTMTIKIKAY